MAAMLVEQAAREVQGVVLAAAGLAARVAAAARGRGMMGVRRRRSHL